MSSVRTLPGGDPAPVPRRPRQITALVAAGLMAAGVLTLARAPGVTEADPVAVPELAAPVPPAVSIVEDFHAALAVGDAARAAGLIAPGAAPLALPGLPFAYLPDDADPETLAAAFDFYAAVMDLAVTDCAVDQRSLTEARVGCQVRISSPLATAGRIADLAIPTMYTVADGRIVAVLRGPLGSPYFDAYCHWVERTVGLAAGQLFDTDCRPVPSPTAVAAHRRLADEFVAAGRPGAYRGYRLSRSGVGVVAVLESAHNQGRSAAGLTFRDEPAADFPGLVGGGAAPTLGEALEWSGVVYRIDLGTCSVDATGDELRAVCPAASWSGPLVEGLGLEALVQPATFAVAGATVSRVEGGTPESLGAAFADFCSWVYGTRPHTASVVFADGCRPIYGADAARRLLVVLSGYTGDPR